jgi:hypothetical protein
MGIIIIMPDLPQYSCAPSGDHFGYINILRDNTLMSLQHVNIHHVERSVHNLSFTTCEL